MLAQYRTTHSESVAPYASSVPHTAYHHTLYRGVAAYASSVPHNIPHVTSSQYCTAWRKGRTVRSVPSVPLPLYTHKSLPQNHNLSSLCARNLLGCHQKDFISQREGRSPR
eukprot:941647-Rhodomonas_salina.1